MRLFLLILISIIAGTMQAQQIPADAYILKSIFGKCDESGDTYTTTVDDEENGDTITYEVYYETPLTLNGKKYLFVVTQAPGRPHMGHVWGYSGYYFFEYKSGKYVIMPDTINQDELTWLGDDPTYELVDIGINKKAILHTFESRGNGHYEGNLTFFYPAPPKLDVLFEIDLGYDNAMWKQPESDASECEASKNTSTYEIVKSDKAWFDVIVTELTYGFTLGCKMELLTERKRYVLRHNGTEYIQVSFD